jgi:hypothetical protein
VDQVGIDLDRDDFLSLFEQRLGQRALARANFDDRERILSAGGRSNSCQDGFASEEMLPQPPPQG